MLTIEQCEYRNKQIMLNAIKWAKGEECLPLEQLDILIVAEYLNISIPKCFNHFVETEKLNHVTASGAYKTIFKTLDKLQKGLLQYNTSKLQ